ncbi:hypothetical protein JCM10207_004555 [Rhodosporidiobolus poonsookiae]
MPAHSQQRYAGVNSDDSDRSLSSALSESSSSSDEEKLVGRPSATTRKKKKSRRVHVMRSMRHDTAATQSSGNSSGVIVILVVVIFLAVLGGLGFYGWKQGWFDSLLGTSSSDSSSTSSSASSPLSSAAASSSAASSAVFASSSLAASASVSASTIAAAIAGSAASLGASGLSNSLHAGTASATDDSPPGAEPSATGTHQADATGSSHDKSSRTEHGSHATQTVDATDQTFAGWALLTQTTSGTTQKVAIGMCLSGTFSTQTTAKKRTVLTFAPRFFRLLRLFFLFFLLCIRRRRRTGGTSTGAIVAIVLVVLLLVAGAGLVWYGSQNDWFGLSSGESAASSAAPQSSSSASSAAPASSPSSVAASATAAATSSSGSTSAGSASATATSEEDSSASKISTFASAMKTEGDGAAKAPQATLFGLQTTNTEPATAWGYGLVTLTDDNKLSTGLLSYFIEGTSTSTTFIPTKAFPAGTPSPPHAISSPTGTVGKQATFPVWISPATVKEKSETVTGFMLSASISAPLFGDMGPVTSLLTSAPFELHEEVMVVIGVWKPLGAEDEDE